MFCRNCLEKNGVAVGSYDAYGPCADCEVMKDLYNMIDDDYTDKIAEYVGKEVTFVDDKSGKTMTGQLAQTDDKYIKLVPTTVYESPIGGGSFPRAVMAIDELQNVSDAHTRMATHGALFYGPYFC